MPGLILKIRKNPGDKVEQGESVVILEAMKMEILLRAPRRAMPSSSQRGTLWPGPKARPVSISLLVRRQVDRLGRTLRVGLTCSDCPRPGPDA